MSLISIRLYTVVYNCIFWNTKNTDIDIEIDIDIDTDTDIDIDIDIDIDMDIEIEIVIKKEAAEDKDLLLLLLLILLKKLLVDFHNPAFGCFDCAHLDTCECVVKLFGNGTHFVHT